MPLVIPVNNPRTRTKRDLYLDMVMFLQQIRGGDYTVSSQTKERVNTLWAQATERERTKYGVSCQKDMFSEAVFSCCRVVECHLDEDDDDHDHTDDHSLVSYVCERHIEMYSLQTDDAEIEGEEYSCDIHGCSADAVDEYKYDGTSPIPDWAQ